MLNFLLSSLVGAYLGSLATLIFIVAPSGLQQSTAFPWWSNLVGTAIGALVGGAISYAATAAHDHRRRLEELKDIAVTLYLELADHVARCCYDYDVPWIDYTYPWQDGAKQRRVDDIKKFLPTNPSVFPVIGAKLALVPENARGHVLRFYLALDRWRREINDISGPADRIEKKGMHIRFSRRLGETLPYAQVALESLSIHVPNWKSIDQEAFVGMYSLANDAKRTKRLTDSSLRNVLLELKDVALDSKKREARG